MAAAKEFLGFEAGAAPDLALDAFVWRRDAAGVAEGVSNAEETSPSTAMRLAAWPLPA